MSTNEAALFIKHIRARVDFCKQNETHQRSNYILSGALKTFHTDKDGIEHVVAFGIEDWWAGDVASFISQRPADFAVQCLEESIIITFSYEKMHQLFEDVPPFERFYRLLIQKAYVHAQKRVISNFSLSAKERYKIFIEKYPQLLQRYPQYLIASYLGITKEFLSKLRKEIAQE